MNTVVLQCLLINLISLYCETIVQNMWTIQVSIIKISIGTDLPPKAKQHSFQPAIDSWYNEVY